MIDSHNTFNLPFRIHFSSWFTVDGLPEIAFHIFMYLVRCDKMNIAIDIATTAAAQICAIQSMLSLKTKHSFICLDFFFALFLF